MTVISQYLEGPHCKMIVEATCRQLGLHPPQPGLGRLNWPGIAVETVKGMVVDIPDRLNPVVVDILLGDIVYNDHPRCGDPAAVEEFIAAYKAVQERVAGRCKRTKEAVQRPGPIPIG